VKSKLDPENRLHSPCCFGGAPYPRFLGHIRSYLLPVRAGEHFLQPVTNYLQTKEQTQTENRTATALSLARALSGARRCEDSLPGACEHSVPQRSRCKRWLPGAKVRCRACEPSLIPHAALYSERSHHNEHSHSGRSDSEPSHRPATSLRTPNLPIADFRTGTRRHVKRRDLRLLPRWKCEPSDSDRSHSERCDSERSHPVRTPVLPTSRVRTFLPRLYKRSDKSPAPGSNWGPLSHNPLSLNH